MCNTAEKPSVQTAEKNILEVIRANPGIKNNDIARVLGYVFDLGRTCRGWFVRNIVDSLVMRGIVARPKYRSTACWLVSDFPGRGGG
ncbi:MAG: winged helix-turn-helix domain-containing protein [Gammaproteobacteria bacterium]